MSFLDQWKKAKEKFETTTESKKPTEKFLGIFRKGNSLESGLKKLDSAKNRKDAIKAIEEFDADSTKYLATLVKSTTDSSTVKREDKAEYLKAIEKLEASLKRIKEEAMQLAESLDATADKTRIDTKFLQEVEIFLGDQRKALEKNTKVATDLKGQAAQIKTYLDGAKKSLVRYKDPKLAGQATINADTIKRFYDESETVRAEARKIKTAAIEKLTASMKDLGAVDSIKARLSEVPSKLVQDAKKNVTSLEQVKTVIEKLYEEMQTNCQEIKTYIDEARPIDRDALLEANEHIALRKRMAGEAMQWAKDAAAGLKQVQTLHTDARKGLASAKTAQTMGLKQDMQKIELEVKGYATSAAQLAGALDQQRLDRGAPGSDLLSARGDSGTTYDKLPPSVGKKLKAESNKAFADLDKVQRVWQEAVAKAVSVSVEVGGILDQIEALNGKVKPASEYLAWLNPLSSTLSDKHKLNTDRVQKIEGMKRTLPKKLEEAEANPEGVAKVIRQMYDIFGQTHAKVAEDQRIAENAKVRASAVPSQEPAVRKAVTTVLELVASIEKNAGLYNAAVSEVDDMYKQIIAKTEAVAV